MKAQLLAAAILCGATMAGCVQNYAEREIVQGAAAATVTFPNAPQEARILIDGRDFGAVSQHPNGVALSSGRHDIIITAGAQQLHKQAVYVSAGARIEVRIP